MQPTGAALGATVEGVCLSAPMSDLLVGHLRRALTTHHVLFLPEQRLSPSEHLEAARRIGNVERLTTAPQLQGHDGIIVFDTAAGYEVGDWHADATFLHRPPAFSLLQMVSCPRSGGDTMWANLHAALDALPSDLRARIEGRVAVHDVPGFGRASHPMVVAHPETGRRSLYVFPDFTREIVGMIDKEAQALLQDLFDHATQERFTCRHSWRPGDMALWDNRSTMHRGVDDFGPDERVIHVIGLDAHEPSAGASTGSTS